MRKFIYCIFLFIGFALLIATVGLTVYVFEDSRTRFLVIPMLFLVFLAVMMIWGSISGIRAKVQRPVKDKVKRPFYNPYVDYTRYEAGVMPPVNYPSLGLYPGEVIYFATPANTFTQTEEIIGYSGSSGGFNIRIAKGLTYRTGGSKGAPIRNNVIKYNPGDFIVTNQRVVFIGIKDSFDIPAEKLTAAKVVATDAFIILAGNKQKNVQMDTSQAVYALGFTRQLISGGFLKTADDDEPQALE